MSAVRYQRSPDRQASIGRRQMYANMRVIPDHIAQRKGMTQAVRSLLTVVALETKANGQCTQYVDALCAIAGVCRSTWHRVKEVAGDLLNVHERRHEGRKSDTNVISIRDRGFQRRIAKSPPPGFHSSSPTTNKSLIKEEAEARESCGKLRKALEIFGSAVAFDAIPYLERQMARMIQALNAPS